MYTIAVSAERHLTTSLGNKKVFYSEKMDFHEDILVDRTLLYAFLTQRLDLTYLMDFYYSTANSAGVTPNDDIWPFVNARVSSMKALYDKFPQNVQDLLGFDSSMFMVKV